MDGQPTYHLVTTPDGQTVPGRFAPGVHISITLAGETSTSQPLDVTEQEFQDMRRKALTHHLHYDQGSKKVVLTPKPPKPTDTPPSN